MQESQLSLQNLQDGAGNFDPTSSNDDFLDQMLSGFQTAVSWPDGGVSGQHKPPPQLPWDVDHFDDQSTFLASKLLHHQISAGAGSGGAGSPSSAVKSLLLSKGFSTAAAGGESGLFQNDVVDDSAFKSPIGENSIQNLFNSFTGSLTSNQTQQFRNPLPQSFGSPGAGAAVMNQGATAAAAAGGSPSQPRQRVRARRGQATDPHSIAERLRRERIAERMKALQELVPNANKTDKASMLDEIIEYVKFLQLQVKVLSMSRLGGAGAGAGVGGVAPLVAEGGGDCGQGSGGGVGGSNNGTPSSSTNDTMSMTENQVVKMMEEDMGSAMQYLQGKGLCLMPISLATAISTATCHPSRANHGDNGGPSSPNMSALTVQSTSGLGVSIPLSKP